MDYIYITLQQMHSTRQVSYVVSGSLRHSTNSAALARRRRGTGGSVAVYPCTTMPRRCGKRNFDNDTSRTIRCDRLVFIPSGQKQLGMWGSELQTWYTETTGRRHVWV